ncbi:hypothetical protein JCM8115_000151 [Rhodotorula mucilaginosa]
MQSSPASTWQPGDPIRFAVPDVAATDAQAGGSSGGAGDEMASESQTARRGGGDREWQTGDPIRFAFGQAKAARDEASRPRPREVGVSPVKKQARTASPSHRQLGTQSSPVSWTPKSWNASSATAPSSPAIVSSGAQTKAQAPSTSQVIPRWTQEDLDLLVEGIDFDDDFVREFEQDAVRTSQHSTKQPVTLSQEELDALVAGIDFTQDIELEEEAGSNAPQTPEAPERHASGSSASPRSPTTSATPASILGDLSRTSSLLEILSQQSPAELRRQYSTVSAIDLCSSSPEVSEKRPSDVAPPATSSRTSPRVAVMEQSDEEEIVIISRRRRDAASTAEAAEDTDLRPPPVPGFFARPPTMPPPPLARAPPSPPPREPAPRRPADARALARFKRDSKASDHAERQAQFRQRWPRTFSYKSWNKDARLVYTSDEAVVEQELDKMTGPLGFDLEWDSFSGYRTQGKTALAQICDEKTILLVHIAKMKRFPPALQKLAEDPMRIKLGVQIAGDASKLQRDFSIRSRGTLDINAVVHHYDPSRYVGRQRKGLIGLQELTGLYLDQFLRKETTVRTGRWSAALDAQQMEYAANDVYASVQVVRQIQTLASVSPERIEDELIELSLRPFNHWSGVGPVGVPAVAPSSPRPPAAINTKPQSAPDAPAPAPAVPTTPEEVLSQRKFEAFSLFHRHELPLAEVTTRMSATRPVKPVTVVWNLLNAHATLEEHEISVAWDLSRLVAAMDEIGDWPERMLEEHGTLAGGLREKHAARVSE